MKSTADILGPGAYSPKPDLTKYKTPTFVFGKGKKGITSKDINPGPGYYDNKDKTFGKDPHKTIMCGRP